MEQSGRARNKRVLNRVVDVIYECIVSETFRGFDARRDVFYFL